MAHTCICLYCKKPFSVAFKSRIRSYCSKKCAVHAPRNKKLKENISYEHLHRRIGKILGRPDRCSKCKKVGKVDLANISNEYREDVTDWEWLCRKCHMESDGRMNNLHRYPKTLTFIRCKQCNKKFMPKQSKIKFCSKPCSTLYVNYNIRDYSKRLNTKRKLQGAINRLPIILDWCYYKDEIYVAQINLEATKKAHKPMMDLSHCMTRAINQIILKTVQWDSTKFRPCHLTKSWEPSISTPKTTTTT